MCKLQFKISINNNFTLILLFSDSLRFIVIGDWGGLPVSPYTTPNEIGVSKEMAKTADQFGSQFTLALGDNFYFDGVKNVEDPRFKVSYLNVRFSIILFKYRSFLLLSDVNILYEIDFLIEYYD